MRVVLLSVVVLASLLLVAHYTGLFVQTASAACYGGTYVSGYFLSNGTYVAGHYRSCPDSNPYNNYSFPGNYNPNTGRISRGSPDTYLRNYYRSPRSYSYTSPYTYSYTSPYTYSYSNPYSYRSPYNYSYGSGYSGYSYNAPRSYSYSSPYSYSYRGSYGSYRSPYGYSNRRSYGSSFSYNSTYSRWP